MKYIVEHFRLLSVYIPLPMIWVIWAQFPDNAPIFQNTLNVIPYQSTKDFWNAHGLHLRFSPENFNFIFHMVQRFLHFEFCKKSANIAYCQLQVRLWWLWCQITDQGEQLHWNLGPLLSSIQISHFWHQI